jgi:hypothetical protein
MMLCSHRMAPTRLDAGLEAGYARQDGLVPIEFTPGFSLGAARAGGAGDIVVRARPSLQYFPGLRTVGNGDCGRRGFAERGRAKPSSGWIARCRLPDLRAPAAGGDVGGSRAARFAVAHELSFDQAASACGIDRGVFAAFSVSGPRTPRGLTQAPVSAPPSPTRRSYADPRATIFVRKLRCA